MGIPGIQQPAVPYGSLIVVTGASGFIGSHVADQALAAGYRVRGTSRDSQKNAWLADHFRTKYGEGQFELAEVKDLTEEHAFDAAVEGATGFIHVAHDMSGSRDPAVAIPLAVNSALNALRACNEAGVRRFVYTSSSFAVTQPKPGAKFTITKDTFNEEALQKVKELGINTDGPTVYGASKVEVERAMKRWREERDSSIVINTIQPNANIGPLINSTKQGYPTSASWVKNLFDHNYAALKNNPGAEHYINVQDDARLHIIALAHPEVKNQRLLAMAGPVSFNEIIALLRKLKPEKSWENWKPDVRDESTNAEAGKIENLLIEAYGQGYTSLEDSVRGNASDLL